MQRLLQNRFFIFFRRPTHPEPSLIATLLRELSRKIWHAAMAFPVVSYEAVTNTLFGGLREGFQCGKFNYSGVLLAMVLLFLSVN